MRGWRGWGSPGREGWRSRSEGRLSCMTESQGREEEARLGVSHSMMSTVAEVWMGWGRERWSRI